MTLPEGFDPAHAVPLSGAQVKFLEFIARNPEGLRRDTFEPVEPVTAGEEFMRYDPQVWPVFLGAAKRRELARAAVAVARLIRSIPRRVFGNDAGRISEFYQIPLHQSEVIAGLLRATDIADTALSRGDFLDTPMGLKCLEFNMSSNLGGWPVSAWLPQFLSVPLLRRFLDESGVRFSFNDPVLLMLEHIAGVARDLAEGGRLDMALATRDGELPGERWMGWFQEEYRAALSKSGLQGSISACSLGELKEAGEILRLRGRRVHILLESTLGFIPAPVLRAALAGTVRVFNGPATWILTNKLNLALLSEQAGSGLFTEEERRVIETYVPWTRHVADEFVDWEGDRVYLPDLMAEERERLVLKPGGTLGGENVHVGRSVSAGPWGEATEAALAQGAWVVQEYVESSSYLFQASESGAAPYDIVWGLFAHGDMYGGAYLRMLPSGGHGVINVSQGAVPAIPLDVE